MVKIGTQPFNMMRKLKNMSTLGGNEVNKIAKGLKKEGYKEIYQRRWLGENIALTGKNAKGDTKTHILGMFRLKTKTNTVNDAGQRVIDKSLKNEFGREISGNTKTLTFADNKLVKTDVTKRGWNA